MKLQNIDSEISDAIENEKRRQQENINLIASENFASTAVLEAQGSIFTNKYAEGYPGRRYYGGCGGTTGDRQSKIFIPCRLC